MKYLSVLLYSVLISCLLPLATWAQPYSISLTPATFEPSIAPGHYWNSLIKITNPNHEPITVTPKTIDFAISPNDTGGALTPNLQQNPADRTHSLAQWITLDTKPITIAGEKSVELPFTITVPEGVEPGGYFAGIGVAPMNEQPNPADITIKSYVSSVIYLNVDGPTVRNTLITNFSSKKFIKAFPITGSLTITNQGTIYTVLEGEVILKKGAQICGRFPIGTQSTKILPHLSHTDIFTFSETDCFPYGAFTLTFVPSERSGLIPPSPIHMFALPIVPILSILGIVILILVVLGLGIRYYIAYTLRKTLPPSRKKRV